MLASQPAACVASAIGGTTAGSEPVHVWTVRLPSRQGQP
jgi:hypothetical protein